MEEIKTVETPTINSETKTNLVKPMIGAKPIPSSKSTSALPIVIFVIVCLLGVGTGYLLYAKSTAGKVRVAGKDVEVVKTTTEEGVKDASTFKDTAEGTIKENDGKITTEGSYILVRPGGASQNIYLTSSVVDLSKYVDKNVQIWGETFQGRTAGWLMDVGRIKVK